MITETAFTQPDRRRLLQMCAAAVAAGLTTGATRAVLSEGAAPLLPSQRAAITAIADTIIPDTDTAGAVKAGVADFIALMVESWYDPADRERFIAGLDAIDARARAAAGKPLSQMTPAARLTLLRAVQTETSQSRGKGAPVPFFLMIKRLTVFGYYTSEAGAAQELTLNLVPGEYQPCGHLGAGEHAFSIMRSSPVFPTADKPASY